ncbi:MAG: ABC transporter transmembrane domain-containing protein [Alphaproteobacteria bacterium]
MTITASPDTRIRPGRAVAELVPYLLRYRGRVVMGGAALAVASASLLSVPQFLGRMIDRSAAGSPESSLGDLPWWLGLFIVVFAVATALRTYMVTWVGERVISDIRKHIYGHLLSLPPPFFETRPTGELLSRLSNDITALQSVISVVVIIGLRSVIQLAGALALMAGTSWRLTMIMVVVAPALGVVARLSGRRVRGRSALNRDREALVVTHIEESINGIDMIKAFTVEDRERERFDRHVEECFDAAKGLFRARAEFTFLVVVMVLGSAGIVGVIGLRQVLAGTMTGGMLTQFLLYMSVASFAAIGLSDIHSEIKRAAGATERLFGLLHETPETVSAPGPGQRLPAVTGQRLPAVTGQRLPSGGGALEMLGVGFAYPARPETPVLADVSLSVAAGETVALIGPSGAGKTTLFRLLLRFHAPERGTIRLDGVDIGALDPLDLRREIAIVAQEPLIFTGTAMDNIRHGRVEASDAEVIEAAVLAQADGFLRALPAGYQTPLGHKGHQLSSGQRQRVAIARAILRRPRLMLLDEASSFLDAENEAALREVLEPFLRQRTSLIVAHRPSLVRCADRVVVLDQGRIVAQGSHAALLHTNDFYSNLMKV